MSVFVSVKWKEYLLALKIWQAVWWREWTPLPDWYHDPDGPSRKIFEFFLIFGLIYARSCQNISLEYDQNYKNRSLRLYLGCCQDIFKIHILKFPKIQTRPENFHKNTGCLMKYGIQLILLNFILSRNRLKG